MPTFNRRATIRRAVDSVLAQTYQDWELIVVDDGSTDQTAEALRDIDPRIRILVQANRGAAAARNAGIAACRGRYITFLDSDDEWLPHFLALTCGFLDRHPAEMVVATESYDVKYDGRCARQDVDALTGHYVWLARRLGSRALDRQPGHDDDYLRVYERVERLGDWAAALVPAEHREAAGLRWYRGDIFEKYRWGYFHALWCIVARREIVAAIGPFAEHRSSCNDLEFLIELARRASSNLLAVPSVRKNLVRGGSAAQISRGRAYVAFAHNFAEIIHHYYVRERRHDAEALNLYAFRRLEAAKAALSCGLRGEARAHLAVAGATLHWPSVWMLRAVAWLSPTPSIARLAYDAYRRLQDRFASLI